MTRSVAIWAAALVVTACDGGKAGDGDADAPQDTVIDTAGDTADVPDATDTAFDTIIDTTDTVADTAGDEVAAVCGNLTVEPGERCDPPGLDADCTTACGTAGRGQCTIDCQAAAAHDCRPPAERCNLGDDDCDGLVDEGTVSVWARVTTLAPGAGAASPGADVASTDEGFAVVWVTEPGSGTDDAIHLALTDHVGNVVVEDTTLVLAGASDVLGRPAVVWTQESLLMAWMEASGGRSVAVVETDGTVSAERSTPAVSPAGGVDMSWAASHAALAWVSQIDADTDVQLVFVDAYGVDEGAGMRITEAAGDATAVDVDASATAVAVTWIDRRSGAHEARLAVVDHAGATLVADAPLTSTGNVGKVSVAAEHRLVAYADQRASVPGTWVLALDASWDPVGAEILVDDRDGLALRGVGGGIVLGVPGALFTLEKDGTPADTGMALPFIVIGDLDIGEIAVAATGAGEPDAADLVLALAGCAQFETCSAWTSSVTALSTRTGADDVARFVGHDAALEGSFSDRPVTYLSVQIFQDDPFGGPTAPGGHVLTGVPYESCGTCVLLYEGCDLTGCDAVYLATAGKLSITDIGYEGDRFSGTLSNVQLALIDLDSADRSSTFVEGGPEICLGSYEFDEVIGGI